MMNVGKIDALSIRKPDTDRYPDLDMQFPARWSPRAMSGESLTQVEVETIVEAARWAPSCFNAQPWRFAYALRTDAEWERFLSFLIAGNRVWAKDAGALIAVAARKRYERNDEPAPTHAFDAGAAWMALALQAARMGLVTHGMWGFHQESARTGLELPEVYDLYAMIAVGYPGDRDDLPEALRDRETPSPRKPLREICLPGGFAMLDEAS